MQAKKKRKQMERDERDGGKKRGKDKNQGFQKAETHSSEHQQHSQR